MPSASLNARQMEVLRMMAAGEVKNMGYGNSNVDNRTFHSLIARGFLMFDGSRRDGDRWVVSGSGKALVNAKGL